MAWVKDYRPAYFREVLGNHYLIQKLMTMLTLDNLPQALMLVGEQGTGKTSLARILASTLMCDDMTDEGERCGTCATCQSLQARLIKEGTNVQGVPIYEYDITKFNKREDISKIVERIQQRILSHSKSVYILDEIQRASPEAQSCFLKVIEEPNPNVVVLLCTTDEEKLIPPLRSRFHRLAVHKPQPNELVEHLRSICREKGVNFQVNALKLIATQYRNLPREAINKLEFIALTGDVTVENAIAELNIIQTKHYYTFFEACFKGNLSLLVEMVEELENQAQIDIPAFVEGLGMFLTDMLKARAGVVLDRYNVEEIRLMAKWAKRFTNQQMAQSMALVERMVGQTTNYTSFTLMALAVELSEILAVIPTIQVPTNQEVLQEYQQVTQQVLETTIGLQTTPTDSVSVETFMDIFGQENVAQVQSGAGNTQEV